MLHRLTRIPRRRLRESVGRYALALVVAVAIALVAGLGGSWGTALGQTVPPPPAPAPPSPSAFPLPPLPGGITLSGPTIVVIVPTGGGTVGTPLSFIVVTIPGTGGSISIVFTPVDPGSLGSSLGSNYLSAGILFGDGALLIQGLPGSLAMSRPAPPGFFQAAAVEMVPLGQQRPFVAPLLLTYSPTPADMDKAGGNISRIVMGIFTDKGWLALPTSPDPANGKITATVPFSGVVAAMIVPTTSGGSEVALSNGRFFSESNGFGGVGGTGFTVTDDDSAAFWTEFQRMGGVPRVGYPVSGRFFHGGFITQAFQKMALQWRPELGMAVPVNIFDDLNRRGDDSWLDTFREVPPAADTSPDTGLPFDAVVARHLSILVPYPPILSAVQSDPNWEGTFGLPLSVKDYGPMVGVRMQRATLQMWKVNVPWATAGTVIIGNGGDLAKEAGLWPVEAVVPLPLQ